MDSGVVCMFCVVQDLIWDFAQVVTGWDITKDKWCTEHGRRIVTLQRAQVLLGGPDVFWNPDKDDDNPPRFYEPLPSGPYKGLTTDKKVVEQKKQEYYTALGWDKRGIPRKETLEKLDLQLLERVMKKLRK
jgi:aldehyde:ferredoxin oxidoreductase